MSNVGAAKESILTKSQLLKILVFDVLSRLDCIRYGKCLVCLAGGIFDDRCHILVVENAVL